MTKVYRIHEVHQQQAYSMWETGTGYALGYRETNDTLGYYRGDCETTNRVFEPASPVIETYTSREGYAVAIFDIGGERVPWLLDEILDHNGHTIDPALGHTRPEREGDDVVEDWHEEIRNASVQN